MATPTASRPSRVVVVAFGPADLTSDSVRRARKLVTEGGDVVVVAAHREAAPNAAVPIGTDGLRASLAPGATPVLVLHDDVRIGRDSVAAMMRAWRATGCPTVPWANVAGTSHNVAEAVPADDDARARLTRRLALRGQRATVARPVCLLADGATVRKLGERFITVADTVWSDPTVAVTAASKALAHHAGRCTTVTGIAPDPARPLLVASMIVRDEATRLPDCLASLKGLVDRIEICDTGSTDDTVAIAEAFGADVIHRQWRDDFAWARNEVLDRCRDASYILQIDADERARCDDPEAVRRQLALLVDSVRVFSVAIDNVDRRGHIGSTHDGSRILRTDGTTYRGALHERPWSTDDTVTLISLELKSLRLEHHGYQQQIVSERGKSARNLAISEHAYRETPNWETAFQYARSLSLADDNDRQHIAELLNETLAAGNIVPITWRAWSLAKLGRDALQADDEETALDLAQRALRLVPADAAAGAVLAEAAQRLGRTELIVDQRTTRRSSASPKPFTQLADAASRLAGAEIAALFELGAAEEAFDEAAAAWHADPAHFVAWPALVRSVAGAADVDAVDDLLVSAALNDASGNCIEAVARGLPAARATRLCAHYVLGGGSAPSAVRNGIATALVAGDPALVDPFLPEAHRLEPGVLERLADVAAQRGLDAHSHDLRTLAALSRRNFVVCGAARSAMDDTGRALTALGHPCGHEIVFDPFTHGTEFGAAQGDASWLALPYLDDLPADAVIFHQVRDPLEVVRALAGTHLLTAASPYLDFIAEHAPEVLAHPDELSRCMAHWVVWNRRLEAHADGTRPYVRYRLEDLTPDALAELAGLLGSAHSAEAVRRKLDHVTHERDSGPRDASITLAALPDGPTKREMLVLAAEFGYEVSSLVP